MRRAALVIGILVVALLGAYRARTVAEQVPGADEVHASWIAALRANDRAALERLAGDVAMREAFIDESMRGVASELRSSQNGPLIRVELRSFQDDPAGKFGLSRWVFARRTLCYLATLSQDAGRWQVVSWGQGPLARCA